MFGGVRVRSVEPRLLSDPPGEQIRNPLDEHAHLGRKVAVLRIHDPHGQRVYLPVGQHARELPAGNGILHHESRGLHDPQAGEPRFKISLAIIQSHDTIELEIDALAVLAEIPPHDPPRLRREVAYAAMAHEVAWVHWYAVAFEVSRCRAADEIDHADAACNQRRIRLGATAHNAIHAFLDQ